MILLLLLSFAYFSLSVNAGTIIDLSDLDTALKKEQLFSSLYNISTEWGVYKPNLYFGVKNR